MWSDVRFLVLHLTTLYATIHKSLLPDEGDMCRRCRDLEGRKSYAMDTTMLTNFVAEINISQKKR